MRHKALSIIEIIVVIGLFTMLLAFVAPQMVGLILRNDIEVASQELVHVLRKANAQASTQVHDSAWGVNFDSGNAEYTLFSGTGYSSRNSDRDIIYTLPNSISFGSISLNGGGTEVVFDQITGESSQHGTLEISGSDGQTRTISINSLGNVSSD